MKKLQSLRARSCARLTSEVKAIRWDVANGEITTQSLMQPRNVDSLTPVNLLLQIRTSLMDRQMNTHFTIVIAQCKTVDFMQSAGTQVHTPHMHTYSVREGGICLCKFCACLSVCLFVSHSLSLSLSLSLSHHTLPLSRHAIKPPPHRDRR